MISTQRLALIVIFVNLLIGTSSEWYENSSPTMGQFESYINYTDNNIQGLESDNAKTPPQDLSTSQSYESSLYNSLQIGSVVSIFFKSIVPFSTLKYSDSELEYYIQWLLSLIRLGLNVLLVVEMYMFFKNRKNT